MKKYTVLALALSLVVGGVAFAAPQDIGAAFFLDNAGNGFPPTGSGLACYIRVNNNTASTINVSVAYYDPDGTPANTGTGEVPPLATIAFRPVADDISSEDAVGNAFPDKTGIAAGVCVITWDGAAGDLDGSVTQLNVGATYAFGTNLE
jgi:hypothetical protein